MFKKLISALAGTVIALSLLMPAGVFAQDFDYEYDWESLSTSEDYLYTTTDLTDEEAAAFASFALIFGGVGLIISIGISLIIHVYFAITLSAIAKKLKEPNAWFAWVPLLNAYLMVKLAKLNPWSFLLFLIPGVNIVYFVYLMMKISERRGFPNWIGILIIIPVLGWALPGYLAWGEPSKA